MSPEVVGFIGISGDVPVHISTQTQPEGQTIETHPKNAGDRMRATHASLPWWTYEI
jgi:hypothetical protein